MTTSPAIAQQLVACGLPVFPCHENKQPAIKGGFSSAQLALGAYWPSDIVGLPVPAGVVIIDIDAYKGMTTEKIEQVLGHRLDWAGGYLQNTPNGGQHYAFRTSALCRQGSDLFETEIGKGFDTRAPGSGYIATGERYPSTDLVGVLKLAAIDALPQLPPIAEQALQPRTVEPGAEDVEKTPREASDDEVARMLEYISADCSRSEWLKVGLALKHQYAEQDQKGFELFNEWSSSAPEAYDAKEARKLWDTVKSQGVTGAATVTLGTLAHKAISAGYVPTNVASIIFGGDQPGEQWVDGDTLDTLLADLHREGGNVENIEKFAKKIQALPCSALQRKGIVNVWQRVFADHGLKFTSKELMTWCKPAPILVNQVTSELSRFADMKVDAVNALGTVHGHNAKMLIDSVFSTRLASFGDSLNWWNGRNWEGVSKHELLRKVASAFGDSEFGKVGNIEGTEKMLRLRVPHHKRLAPVSRKVFFNNGVLDLDHPGIFLPHHPDNFNNSCLSVDYAPAIECPNWQKFTHDIFGDEPDRILLLQEIMGWALINDNLGHQKAVALDGVPRSGKGTILEVLHMMLNDNMVDMSLDQMAEPKVMSSMRGTNVTTDRDAKRPAAKNAANVHSMFNKITANEPVSIPLLWSQEPWNDKLNTKLFVACNGIPVMADDSGAAPKRWVVLKFNKSFLGREDLGLINRLAYELPAICAWAIDGLKRLMATGNFTMPASSVEESDAISEASSPYMTFTEERLIVAENEKVHDSDIWASFRAWCLDTNNRLPSRQQFIRGMSGALAAKGVTHKRSVRIGHNVRPGFNGCKLQDAAVIPKNVQPISQGLIQQ